MAQCPSCDAAIGPDETECSKCGAKVGATTSFEAISTDETPAQPVSGAADGPVLIVRKGPQPGERFFIDRPRLVIGRDPVSDIFLNDMTVSRAHALVEYESGIARVSDAGSLNGTYVNGSIMENAVLHDGDVLQIGTFQMLFLSGS